MIPTDLLAAVRSVQSFSAGPDALAHLRSAAELERAGLGSPGTSLLPTQAGTFSSLLDQHTAAANATAAGSGSRIAPAAADSLSGLGQMFNDVNARQHHAAAVVREMQAGGQVPLHQAIIAMDEAQVSFQLMVEIRNKVLEAYHEVMRMQV